MGVKGLASLLFNDQRRFGTPWELGKFSDSDDSDEGVDKNDEHANDDEINIFGECHRCKDIIY